MKKIITILMIISILTLSSCATIISGSRQKVNFSSTPSNATVLIDNINMGKTPITLKLKRGDEHNVTIKLDGYEPYNTILNKQFNAWYIGNILFGGLIGLVIDPITGAMFKLSPKQINTELIKGTAFNVDKKNNIYIAVSLKIDPNWDLTSINK